MPIVSNSEEYSCMIGRANQNLDFAVFRQECELTIGLTDRNGKSHREITLSPDEARQLREHLNDPETLRILGI